MIQLTQDQFDYLKHSQNPEIFTENQISNWIIDYTELLQKAELDELNDIEKAEVNQFNDEFKSFTKIQVVSSPKEDDLNKGLVYTNYYIREQQIKWDEDIVKSEDGKETIEKAKSGVYLDSALNRSLNRVGERFESGSTEG